jgi:hypothetical protein
MDEPAAGAPMVSELRELARRRWTRNSELQQRRETWRRMYAAFFLGVALVVLGLLLVETTARRIAGPTAQQIEKGLGQ